MRILAFLWFALCSLHAQTAESILDRAAKAQMGPHPEAIKSCTMAGQMVLAGKIHAKVEVLFKEGGKVYVKMDAPAMGFQQEQGCDGKECYSKDPFFGLRKLDGQEKEALLSQYDLAYMKNWRANFKDFEFKGKETLDGKETLKVFTRTIQGMEATTWYDAKSFLPIKSNATVVSPMGTMSVETLLSEYATLENGMQIAKKMVSTTMGQNAVLTLDNIEFGKPMPDSIFNLPPGL